ncbi:hypothetical protein EV356DRAFT_575190 [Viridothelium virens]|uniref:SMODS and SLOG-associating 2TM effector domain-containing protein n=1 Tax=Viridothelium virens TaxID=1048519 RepID=A0A6A6HFJ2_VIRVR|nr:hypothetical protein EV356DRAFT_575190 [Viridothelium virens]
MHEIPADLTKSLRSYRGSVHSKSPVPEDRTRSPTSTPSSENDDETDASSVVQHPTGAIHHLRHTGELQKQSQSTGPNNTSAIQTLPPVSAKDASKLSPKKPTAMASPIDPDPIAAREQDNGEPLTEPDFYGLMGMRPPAQRGQTPKKLSAEHGLYCTVLTEHNYINRKYKVYDLLVYVFLILQIILSAIFIVLGALQNIDSHIAVATLGAVSTVVGGVLAIMKGQGLPNRLRMTRTGLRNVLLEAEELYYDVGAGRKVLYSDVKKVREDYLRVLEEANRNHPDTWNATATDAAQGTQVPGGKSQQAAANGKPTAPKPAKSG